MGCSTPCGNAPCKATSHERINTPTLLHKQTLHPPLKNVFSTQNLAQAQVQMLLFAWQRHHPLQPLRYFATASRVIRDDERLSVV